MALNAAVAVAGVLHIGGLHHAIEKAVLESVLGWRPGIVDIEAIPVPQTANVTLDPDVASVMGALLHRSGTENPVDAVAGEGTSKNLRVHKAAGDHPIGAIVNQYGTLRARATAVGADTALAQILHDAQNPRAPGDLIDRPVKGLLSENPACRLSEWAIAEHPCLPMGRP